jgi:thiamine biosynthesis lipoprotein
MLAGSLTSRLSADAVSAKSEPRPQLFSASHAAMATTFSLYLYARSQTEADKDADLVFEEIDRVEDLLSNYRQSSELSRINRGAAVSPVTTDPETFHFLETALSWSARSNGAFDISVGQLMKTWGFFHAEGHVPSESDLSEIRYQVGWKKI